MKKILKFTLPVVLAAFAASCVKDAATASQPESGLQLTFVCASPQTRAAQEPGDGRENYVSRIDWFFFQDETSKPFYQGTFTPEAGQETAGAYSFELTPDTPGIPDNLFPGGRAIFYAVANYDGDLSGKSLTQMKQLPVSDTFGSEAELTADGSDRYLVMTAETVLTPGMKEPVIALKRLASKLSLTLDFGSDPIQTTDGDEMTTWTPLVDYARVRLEKKATNALLGGGSSDGEDGYYLPDDLGLTYTDYIPYSESRLTNHIYTYPQRWEEGAVVAPALKLIIRWEVETRKDGKTIYKGISDERYYKIMLPGVLSLDANVWYQLTAAVRVSPAEKEPLIELSGFTVLNWSDTSDDTISATIPDVKYISPERASVQFFGQSTTVSYVASGPVVLSIDKIYQVRYTSSGASEFLLINNEAAQTANIASLKDASGATLTEAAVRGWVSYDDAGKTVSVDHALCNDFTKTYFDATPYVYVLRLHLDGESSFYDKVITLTQTPSFVLRQIKSNHKVFVNGTGAPDSGTNRAYSTSDVVSTSISTNFIGTVYSESEVISSTYNNSEYLTLVSAAISNDYPITDPRTVAADNLKFWATDKKVTLDGLTNNGGYYHSTRKDIEGVAPLFLIASSYGKTSVLSYNRAVVRCAAYQEAGYPAGRWRVPTEKEIEFLISLNKNGLIENLFYSPTEGTSDADAQGYWAASGRYYAYQRGSFSDGLYSNKDGKNINQHVRCVYDAWYWGEEPLDNNGRKTTAENAATKWLGYAYANKISND